MRNKKITGGKMKKSKRVISILVMVLCCVLNCNYVFADNIPTYYISEKIDAEKTLTVKVSFTEDVAAAGTIKLSYNTEILKLLSAEKGTSKAQMITLNENELGTVSINFLNAEDVIKDDTNIAVLNFSINSDEISEYDIKAESFKLYNLDSNLLSDNTTTVPVYKLDKENMPADISVTSRDEEVSREPSEAELPAGNSDTEASAAQSGNTVDNAKNNSNQTIETSNVSASTEDVSTVQQNTSEQNASEEKEVSDDNTSSDLSSQGADEESSLPTQQSEGVVGEESISQTSNADVIQDKHDNTALYVIIMAIVMFIALCAALAVIKIIKKQKNKEMGGHQNEK